MGVKCETTHWTWDWSPNQPKPMCWTNSLPKSYQRKPAYNHGSEKLPYKWNKTNIEDIPIFHWTMIMVESSVVFFPPLNGPFLGEERIAHPSIFLTTLEVTEPWLSSKMSNFLGKKTRQTWNLTEGIQVFEDQITNPKKTNSWKPWLPWFGSMVCSLVPKGCIYFSGWNSPFVFWGV